MSQPGSGQPMMATPGSANPEARFSQPFSASNRFNQLAGGSNRMRSGAGKGGGQVQAAPSGPATPMSNQPPNMFNQASQAIQSGMAGAYGEMGYQPMMVDPNMGMGTGQSVGQEQISQFFNPYESQVVESVMSDIERARLMQANQLGAQTQSAGAFGGARHGIMESELGRNALDQMARSAANLRLQGYSQALGAAQSEADRLQQAQQFGAGQGLQAMLANQAAGLAGSGQRLAAGQQLANIGNMGFGQAQSVQANMQQQGLMQQALQQQLMDASRNQYAGYSQFPGQSLGYYAQALGATQIPQSQTTSRQPGLFDYLTLGLSASDIQLKTDIKVIGLTQGGHNVYEWTWNEKGNDIGEHGRARGVIAQEVAMKQPEAVIRGNHGYLMVDYSRIH